MTLLDEFKEYVRVDGDDEDTTLSAFLAASRATLKNSGVSVPKNLLATDDNGEKIYPLHFLAVITLASHYYENRQLVSQQSQNIVPFSVQQMILQLKWVEIDESSEA